MNKYRICFPILDLNNDNRPGPSDVVWDMADHLIDAGHEVVIIAPKGVNIRGKNKKEIIYFDVPFSGYRWVGGHLWISRRISAIIKKIDIDLVHTPEYLSSAVIASLNRNTPVVLTAPGNIFQRLTLDEGNQASFLYTQVIKWAAKTSARKCDAVIAFTSAMEYWWVKTGCNPTKVFMIPYGIDIEHFKPIEDNKPYVNNAKKTISFLYVGRLDREKGLFDTINAFKLLSRNNLANDWKFDIVGAGNLSTDLKRTIEEFGLEKKVFFHGSREKSELPSWYSAADVLILPSWVEPFGRVMLEAMACGTPVLASATDGPKDHIIEGRNGWLFIPRDVNSLVDKMIYILNHPEQISMIGKIAHIYVRENLSWSKITKRIISEVYQPIISNK